MGRKNHRLKLITTIPGGRVSPPGVGHTAGMNPHAFGGKYSTGGHSKISASRVKRAVPKGIKPGKTGYGIVGGRS